MSLFPKEDNLLTKEIVKDNNKTKLKIIIEIIPNLNIKQELLLIEFLNMI